MYLSLYCGVFLLALLGICGGEVSKKVRINKVDYEADTKLITLDIKVKTGASGNTVVDLDGHLLHDIEDTIFVNSAIAKKVGENQYQTMVKTQRMNMCDFFKKPEKEPFLKMFFENLREFGHMMDGCPLKKDHYYLENFELLGEKLPSFTPSGDYKVDFSILKKANNNFTQIFRMIWYATII